MLFLDAEAVFRHLTWPVLIQAIEDAHRRPPMQTADAMIPWGQDHYYTRHAVDPGRYLASKLISSFPANRERGDRPTIQALCVLFDGANGQPLAVLDGTAITWWRTAADSALASRLLSREDAQTLVVVGAGALSPWLIAAHRAVRPGLRRVLVWNRDAGRARALCDGLEGAEPVADLDAALGMADIVTCATPSRAPLIRGARLRPGTHLDLVGSQSPDTREADDDALRLGRVFVDNREAALDTGDLIAPLASGAIGPQDVLGDLYDLVQGTVAGRQNRHEITVYKNAGGGHLDLIACETVYRLASRSPG